MTDKERADDILSDDGSCHTARFEALLRYFADVREEEREACAEICDKDAREYNTKSWSCGEDYRMRLSFLTAKKAAKICAENIRARGEEK